MSSSPQSLASSALAIGAVQANTLTLSLLKHVISYLITESILFIGYKKKVEIKSRKLSLNDEDQFWVEYQNAKLTQ